MLYTISFTTRHMVSKYDDKGNLISDYTADIPQTMTALPYATAMQYSDCDNFRCERYHVNGESPKGSYQHKKSAAPAKTVTAKPAVSTVKTAAATGNLAAAVSKP